MSRDSLDEFTGGDRAAAENLRRSLRAMSEHYAGTPLARQVQGVLDGRTTLRELAGDPEFASMTQQGMREFAETWQSMSPQERSDAMAEGEAYGAGLKEELRRR
jgi:hypothetical protein